MAWKSWYLRDDDVVIKHLSQPSNPGRFLLIGGQVQAFKINYLSSQSFSNSCLDTRIAYFQYHSSSSFTNFVDILQKKQRQSLAIIYDELGIFHVAKFDNCSFKILDKNSSLTKMASKTESSCKYRLILRKSFRELAFNHLLASVFK